MACRVQAIPEKGKTIQQTARRTRAAVAFPAGIGHLHHTPARITSFVTRPRLILVAFVRGLRYFPP